LPGGQSKSPVWKSGTRVPERIKSAAVTTADTFHERAPQSPHAPPSTTLIFSGTRVHSILQAVRDEFQIVGDSFRLQGLATINVRTSTNIAR
jgi:hypothetical protein